MYILKLFEVQGLNYSIWTEKRLKVKKKETTKLNYHRLNIILDLIICTHLSYNAKHTQTSFSPVTHPGDMNLSNVFT